MSDEEQKGATPEEVLVFDSTTFIREIGLMSERGSALKHYLYSKGVQLVVPAAAAEECERHLSKRAKGKIRQIQGELDWLARFCDGVNGWSAPSDDVIEARAKALATGNSLGVRVLSENKEDLKRAKLRDKTERPPSQNKAGLGDCRIWEQCLVLLKDHDVVFLSGDKDFRGHRKSDELHPELRAEAEEVGAGRTLTFHRNIESLLSELKSEIPPIPDDVILAFVYDAISDTVQELESNSGCRPKAAGKIRQTPYSTDQADLIEIRLEVEDTWESDDGETVRDFYLSGSCQYNLGEERLTDLKVGNVRLASTQPDGSLLAVTGSYVSLSAQLYAGPRPIEPLAVALTGDSATDD